MAEIGKQALAIARREAKPTGARREGSRAAAGRSPSGGSATGAQGKPTRGGRAPLKQS